MEAKYQKRGLLEGKTLGWWGFSYGAGALAGLASHRILEASWKACRHTSTPVPADRRSSWTEALSWAVATGVGMGISRLLAIRTAAVIWEVATNQPPTSRPDVDWASLGLAHNGGQRRAVVSRH
jgi:hypothetical protein